MLNVFDTVRLSKTTLFNYERAPRDVGLVVATRERRRPAARIVQHYVDIFFPSAGRVMTYRPGQLEG